MFWLLGWAQLSLRTGAANIRSPCGVSYWQHGSWIRRRCIRGGGIIQTADARGELAGSCMNFVDIDSKVTRQPLESQQSQLGFKERGIIKLYFVMGNDKCVLQKSMSNGKYCWAIFGKYSLPYRVKILYQMMYGMESFLQTCHNFWFGQEML